jgi:hypothetical protein
MHPMLRMGSRGDDVSKLQALLQKYDPTLRADGVFGPRTERAVRLSQRRNGLYPPDGIAGPMTMRALNGGNGGSGGNGRLADGTPTRSVPIPAARSAGVRQAQAAAEATAIDTGTGDPGRLTAAVGRSRERAQSAPMASGTATDVGGMHLSRRGRRFIYDHEAQVGVSHRLHHPSSGSGVTIGPGYDMKDRSAASVEQALIAVGVPQQAARTAAQGAGKSGDAAARFVRDHRDTLNLSAQQQADLLVHIAPHYEGMVRRAIKVPLHQHEFDAMVSYAYNPGGGWRKTTGLVNEGKPHDAMLEIKRHVYSKGQLIKSLQRRRDAEAKMFIYGEYE